MYDIYIYIHTHVYTHVYYTSHLSQAGDAGARRRPGGLLAAGQPGPVRELREVCVCLYVHIYIYIYIYTYTYIYIYIYIGKSSESLAEGGQTTQKAKVCFGDVWTSQPEQVLTVSLVTSI